MTSPVAKISNFYFRNTCFLLNIPKKYVHLPQRYNRKREWVSFSEHSVVCHLSSVCQSVRLSV